MAWHRRSCSPPPTFRRWSSSTWISFASMPWTQKNRSSCGQPLSASDTLFSSLIARGPIADRRTSKYTLRSACQVRHQRELRHEAKAARLRHFPRDRREAGWQPASQESRAAAPTGNSRTCHNRKILLDASVAQWIEHWSSEPGVAGSSPAGRVFFCFCLLVTLSRPLPPESVIPAPRFFLRIAMR